MEKILKTFGITDGLLKGTALLSNIFTTASVAILPGFGPSGLFLANTIQMTIAGLLEIPTGLIADKFGSHKALILALALKFFVTSAFLGALFAAYFNFVDYIWYFFAIEAIVDAFASSFLSGSYQSAYMQWYESHLKTQGLALEKSPALFLASFRFGQKIRFLVPSLLSLLILSLGYLSKELGLLNGYAVVFVTILIIFVLRIVVLWKVVADFKAIRHHGFFSVQKDRFLHKNWFKFSFWREMIAVPYFAIYTSAIIVNCFSVFYIVGQAFRTLKASGFANQYVWGLGLLFGLTIYLARTLIAVILFPRLAGLEDKKRVILTAFSFALLALCAAVFLLTKTQLVLNTIALFVLGLGGLVASDAIQKSVESSLKTLIPTGKQATWMSLSNAAGMLVFGLLSAGILTFSLETIATPVFCVFVFLFFTLSCIPLFFLNLNVEEKKTFSAWLTKALLTSIGSIGLTILLIDVVSFGISTYQMQVEKENSLMEVAAVILDEPLLQGSFIEAKRRLNVLSHTNQIHCIETKLWDFQSSSCDDQIKNRLLFKGMTKNFAAVGQIEVFFDRIPIVRSILKRMLVSLFLLGMVVLALSWRARKIAVRLAEELDVVLNFFKVDQQPFSTKTGLQTIELQYLSHEIAKLLESKTEFVKNETLTRLSTQLAHDIRSPLAALDVGISEVSVLSEENRILIRRAVQRIHDIANDLLAAQRYSQQLDSGDQEELSAHLLSGQIDILISEKRAQYRNGKSIEIQTEFAVSSYGLFSIIRPNLFKRVISNLINNAVEAIEKTGLVTVSLAENGGWIAIAITDNGKGIPLDILPKLMRLGETHGKDNGSGMGLFHAKTTIESWGGSLDIDSPVGNGECGTRVTLRLPKAEPPKWFVPELLLSLNSQVVVIDDDDSIHAIWENRFEELLKKNEVKLLHFSSLVHFSSWFQNTGKNETSSILILCDYEFVGEKETGLDLIKKLKIAHKTILVTSRFEDHAIRSECERLNIRLIPKNLAGFVPICTKQQKAEPESFYKSVLIDDDDLIRNFWQRKACDSKITLDCFEHFEDFLNQITQYDKQTQIYVDSNLKGKKGEECARELFDLGFRKIILTSGYEKNHFPSMPWIADVIGKSPPWN